MLSTHVKSKKKTPVKRKSHLTIKQTLYPWQAIFGESKPGPVTARMVPEKRYDKVLLRRMSGCQAVPIDLSFLFCTSNVDNFEQRNDNYMISVKKVNDFNSF